MAIDRNKLIGTLVADLKPTRPHRPPWVRTGAWFVVVAISTFLITYAVQEFRPNFWAQLIQFRRFDIELVSGAAWTLTLFYAIFVANVPGEKISLPVRRLSAVLLTVFVGSIVAAFAMESPEASRLGARPLCDLEVLIYGGGALAGFLFLLRKGILSSNHWDRWRIGLSAGLISALTMQLACMYDPWHALLFHYGPALVLALLGGYAIHYMKKRSSQENLQLKK